MMLALMLAQLVLPWPGLDSPLVQPGPTICLGACAGPVVWGPAERGRLVVACDMRSDTCSDGRKITTTRSTPVPCETSPGVWEIIPADQGCYSVRGLESWAATTSYLAYGAELDRAVWSRFANIGVTKLAHSYLLTGDTTSSRLVQAVAPAAGTHTLACQMRSDDPHPNVRLRIYPGSGDNSTVVPVTTEWATHSMTATFAETPPTLSAFIYPGTGTVEVAGCWLTRTSTPGRPCWGGEAPVTCANDRHTISTEGWPTTEGEICISAEVEADATRSRWLIDGRGQGATGNSRLFVRQDTNALALFGPQGNVDGGTVAAGQHRLCVQASGGTVRLSVDGVVVAQRDAEAPMAWFPMATIGSSFSAAGGSEINGSISNLRIRSTE